MRRLGKKSKNASECTKRWSDHEVEQLIDLLEENSCLWDVSNKDYYLRKKRERAYKQRKSLGQKELLKNNDLTPTMLAVVAFVCMHHATSANNSQHCWVQQCCDLLRPFAWAFSIEYG